MNKLQLLSLLEQILGRGRQLKNNEVAFFCPFCHHHKPKLQVNLESYNYNCWVCHTSGKTLFSLFKKLNASKNQFERLAEFVGASPGKQRDSEEQEPELFLPQQFRSITEACKDPDYRSALKYLLKRGLTREDMLKHNIGYCDSGDYGGMVIVPSYDEVGKLNYFVGRAFYSSHFKHKNPAVSKNIIGFDMHINWNEPIVLVEGAFDAIAVRRNAIPLFGKHLMLALLQRIVEKKVSRVYVSLDADALDSSLRLLKTLHENDVEVYCVNIEDKDPASLGFDTISKLISEAEPFTFSNMMRLKLKQGRIWKKSS